MKKRGFNLIELLVIIGIVGILLSISGTSYRTWRAQAIFTETNDRLFELFTTSRVNALTEKKCRSGDVSTKWILQINNNITTKNYRMFCNDTTLASLEEPVVDGSTDYIFKEDFVTVNQYIGTSPTSESQIEVEFFPGESQSRINGDFVNDNFRVDIQSTFDGDWQKTICFDRVGSYAYFSTTFGSCVE